MAQGRIFRGRDLALRLVGVLLIAGGITAIRSLAGFIHLRPPHAGSLAEFLLAALGFLSLSGGSMLLAIGAHIFDRIAISPRWIAQVQPVERD